jgi:hypothetical protein
MWYSTTKQSYVISQPCGASMRTNTKIIFLVRQVQADQLSAIVGHGKGRWAIFHRALGNLDPGTKVNLLIRGPDGLVTDIAQYHPFVLHYPLLRLEFHHYQHYPVSSVDPATVAETAEGITFFLPIAPTHINAHAAIPRAAIPAGLRAVADLIAQVGNGRRKAYYNRDRNAMPPHLRQR